MKKSLLLIFSCFAGIFLAGQNTWTQKTSCPGTGLDYPATFSVNGKGYWCTGDDPSFIYTDIAWAYDPATDSWAQMANYAGGARWLAVGFSIGNTGYVGMGITASGQQNDFYSYDPSANSWQPVASCPGSARCIPVSFTIGYKAYVASGLDFSTNAFFGDLWEYDQASNSWTQKTSMPVDRSEAVGFAIGNKGYVAGGYNLSSSGWLNDCWQWDQATDSWTQMANMPDGRVDAAGFAIGCKGYLVCGESENAGGYINDILIFDPVANTWTQGPSITGMERDEMGAVNIDCKGYLAFGQSEASGLLNDIWEYTPDTTAAACCANAPPPPPPPPPADASAISMPNVFSPNGDGINDSYLATWKNITDFNCEIYDRWGVKIYSWSDVTTGWNGKNSKGKDVVDGTYYYVMTATGIDDVKYNLHGFLTLIR